MNPYNIVKRLQNSAIFKDSVWAVFGNGLGSALLLLAGIIIARYLGKDLYGEYGVVKTNMFYLAGFSTFGLGFTTTRFIARYLDDEKELIRGIITSATKITLLFSSLLAVFLCFFAKNLSDYLGEPDMVGPFRFLSVIIVIKAVGTTGVGILAGLHKFKSIAINAVISGILMVIMSVPLTLYYELNGAFISLAASQLLNTGLNYISIAKEKKNLPVYCGKFDVKPLLVFSFPVAMQEISYSVCNWVGILALTKFSTIGEVGIYSATAQWNAVITFIPGLLYNVVLSHLSKRDDIANQNQKVKKLLLVYFICTIIPFLFVYFLADYISSFYGPQFLGMALVLQILTLATIPSCCSDVYKSELLAEGRPWVLFSIRCCKDICFVCLVIFLLKHIHGFGGALLYAIANVTISILFFTALYIAYRISYKSTKTNIMKV